MVDNLGCLLKHSFVIQICCFRRRPRYYVHAIENDVLGPVRFPNNLDPAISVVSRSNRRTTDCTAWPTRPFLLWSRVQTPHSSVQTEIPRGGPTRAPHRSGPHAAR